MVSYFTKLKNTNRTTFIFLAKTGLLALLLSLLFEFTLVYTNHANEWISLLRKGMLAANISIWCYYFLPKTNPKRFNPIFLATITTLFYNLMGLFYTPGKDFIVAHSLSLIILMCYGLSTGFLVEIGIFSIIALLLSCWIRTNIGIAFVLSHLVLVGFTILFDLLLKERHKNALYKKWLVRKRVLGYMIAARLEAIAHAIPSDSLADTLTRKAESCSMPSETSEETATFRLKDYKNLIDANSETKHAIDESVSLVRILKSAMLSEKLPAHHIRQESMGMLLINYKHTLSFEKTEQFAFDLPNTNFSVDIYAPLFNHILEVLAETIFRHTYATKLTLAFDAIKRELYITHKGSCLPQHITAGLLEKEPSNVKGRMALHFVTLLLDDINASISYRKGVQHMRFVIKFPPLQQQA